MRRIALHQPLLTHKNPSNVKRWQKALTSACSSRAPVASRPVGGRSGVAIAEGAARFGILTSMRNQRGCRSFSTDSSVTALLDVLKKETEHENKVYTKPPTEDYLKETGWKLHETVGSSEVSLTREQAGKTLTVDFQLTTRFRDEVEEEEQDSPESGPVESPEVTDFSVTIASPNGSGAIFQCTTVLNTEKFRFIIGNIGVYESLEEKNSDTAYSGPEFEDLDDGMQHAIDEWLVSLGVDNNLCDFIDAKATDKEQTEYMRWLNVMSKVVGE